MVKVWNGTTDVYEDWDAVPTEDLQEHLDDTTAHTAANISFTPAGSVAATNVQAAIVEAASEGGGGGGGTVDSVVAGGNIDVDATDPANPIVSVETLVDADIPGTIARLSDLTTHIADSTAVHGITDMAALETTTGAQAKANAKVDNAAYSSAWDGDTAVAPSRNALYDKIETLGGGGGASVSDTAYAGSWNGVTTIAPSKNAIYDKIEAMGAGTVSDTTYGGSWDGVTTIAPSKNAIYDQVELKLSKIAAGASVENIGAVESNVRRVAATGSTETLDTSTYGVFEVEMDDDCTFTFSNPAPDAKATVFILLISGGFTPTFPGSVQWAYSTPPSYDSESIYTFMTVDGGSIWYGTLVGGAFT